MSAPDLQRIRAAAAEREALLSKATPGEWLDDAFVRGDPYDNPDIPFVQIGEQRWSPDSVETPAAIQQMHDASFIRYAHNTAAKSIRDERELCDEVERLTGELDDVRREYWRYALGVRDMIESMQRANEMTLDELKDKVKLPQIEDLIGIYIPSPNECPQVHIDANAGEGD